MKDKDPEHEPIDELDVEQFTKENAASCGKPHAKIYIIRVDRETIRVSHSHLTGKEILRLVGKTPVTHKLFQKSKGGATDEIEPEESVSFVRPGVERFMTIPCDTTEGGHDEPRREFPLPPEDVAFLDEGGWPWEAVQNGTGMWLLIHEYHVPDGYHIKATSVALQLAANYPDAQIDMAYFFPALLRLDGAGIRQLSDHHLDEKVWQRWSRHRTAQNPWQPGVDGLETHMLLVREWLARELRVAA